MTVNFDFHIDLNVLAFLNWNKIHIFQRPADLNSFRSMLHQVNLNLVPAAVYLLGELFLDENKNFSK